MIDVLSIIVATISLISSVYILVDTVISKRKEIEEMNQLLSRIKKVNDDLRQIKSKKSKMHQILSSEAKLVLSTKDLCFTRVEGFNEEDEVRGSDNVFIARGVTLEGTDSLDDDELHIIRNHVTFILDVGKEDDDEVNVVEYANLQNLKKVVLSTNQNGKPHGKK